MKIDSDQRTWTTAQKSNFHAFSHAREKSERYVRSRDSLLLLFLSLFTYIFSSLSHHHYHRHVATHVGFITITIVRHAMRIYYNYGAAIFLTDYVNFLIATVSPLAASVFIYFGPRQTSAERSSIVTDISPRRGISRGRILRIGFFSKDSLRISTGERGEIVMKTFWTVVLLCVIAAIVAVHAKPTIYKRNEDNVFEPGKRRICDSFGCVAKKF